jgi:hypothetical protein
MLQLPPKQQNLLPKRNINREEKRNRDEKPGEKINPEGGQDLYCNFSDRITDGHLLLSVALNSVGNIRR